MNIKNLFKTAVVIIALTSTINAVAQISEPEFVEMWYSYHDYYGLQGYIEVVGMEPSTHYLLSLQGREGYPSNEILKRIGETSDGVGYKDFKRVKSNDTGYLEADFELDYLPDGEYDVFLTIKESDTGDIVTYDFMNFEVYQDRWWFLDILGTAIIIIGIIIGIIGWWKYGR